MFFILLRNFVYISLLSPLFRKISFYPPSYHPHRKDNKLVFTTIPHSMKHTSLCRHSFCHHERSRACPSPVPYLPDEGGECRSVYFACCCSPVALGGLAFLCRHSVVVWEIPPLCDYWCQIWSWWKLMGLVVSSSL